MRAATGSGHCGNHGNAEIDFSIEPAKISHALRSAVCPGRALDVSRSNQHCALSYFDVVRLALLTNRNVRCKPTIGIGSPAPDPADVNIAVRIGYRFDMYRFQRLQCAQTASHGDRTEKLVRKILSRRTDAPIEFEAGLLPLSNPPA
jgi:hypothetical protein